MQNSLATRSQLISSSSPPRPSPTAEEIVDDLAICYAACLESVGVPAAFITVPGHIYAAVNTGVAPQDIPGTFPEIDDVIVFGGEAWLPVEVTMLTGVFLRRRRPAHNSGANTARAARPN